jgi:hypothetical protein
MMHMLAGYFSWLTMLAGYDGYFYWLRLMANFCCLNWQAILAMQAARLWLIRCLAMFSGYAVRSSWTC